jgi:penicillin-insensitive murein endopeptidase
VQTNAVELPVKGVGFERLRPRGAHYWGNPRLVHAIQQAAATVERVRPGGAPLLVGDLSARYGGAIEGHHSHRTGRDVDLLWYVTTPSGAPIPNPGFVRVDTDGLASVPPSQGYVALDLDRQWLLFKTLLTSQEVAVQFLFVSSKVEALLIDYARAKSESPELVWRAETVMLEPADSASHDDHAHLRIACAPEESIQGCEGGGPYWPWLPEEPTLSAALRLRWLDDIAGDDSLEVEAPASSAQQTSSVPTSANQKGGT